MRSLKLVKQKDKTYALSVSPKGKEGELALPDFPNYDEGLAFMVSFTYMLGDHKAGGGWIPGNPTVPGIYLVQKEDKEFTVIRVDATGGFESIEGQKELIINRYFPLKVKEN